MLKDKIRNDGEVAEGAQQPKHRNVRAHIVALVICLLLAVAVWIVVMGRTDSDYLRLELRGGEDDMNYELSASALEVEGKVADLRHANVIRVYVPQSIDEPGEYRLQWSDLILPDGVVLTGELSLTLKVTAK